MVHVQGTCKNNVSFLILQHKGHLILTMLRTSIIFYNYTKSRAITLKVKISLTVCMVYLVQLFTTIYAEVRAGHVKSYIDGHARLLYIFD